MEYAVYRCHDDDDVWVNQFSTLEEAKAVADDYYHSTGYEYVLIPVEERNIGEEDYIVWDEEDIIYSTYDAEQE